MLYRVQKTDIKQVSLVWADAFQNDPMWIKIYEDSPDITRDLRFAFEVSARHCLKYGDLLAVSPQMEGVIGIVPGEYDDMTPGRIVRSGGITASIRMGFGALKKMIPIFVPVSEDRHKHMEGRTYLYLYIIGVSSSMQGRGYGRKLMEAAIERADKEKLPLYLETESEENVKMYEHFGFRLIQQINLPIIDVPMWEMVKEPSSQ